MRIFLDANVLFSAAKAGSGLEHLVDRLKREHTILTSDYAWEEARRNILSKRPEWSPDFERVVAGMDVLPSVDKLLDVSITAKDRPILATALKAKCDILVTGDQKHFGHLFGEELNGLVVLSPLMVAESLYGAGR